MKHKTWIKNYERDFERLAEEVGDLRYDSLSEFLDLLAKKLKSDAHKDRDRGRRHLAEELYEAKDKLTRAADAVIKPGEYASRTCRHQTILHFRSPSNCRSPNESSD
jgi:monomeric isocitrate dehydrogenase